MADLDFEAVEPCRTQGLTCQRHHLDVGGGAALDSEKLRTRLIELRRTLRLRRLVAKCQAVVAKPRGILSAACDVFATDGNGQVWPEAKLVAGRIGQREGAPADFFARTFKEDVRRLQNRWLLTQIAM